MYGNFPDISVGCLSKPARRIYDGYFLFGHRHCFGNDKHKLFQKAPIREKTQGILKPAAELQGE